jgi:uncharacterized protein YgiM (DUF1202 family)
VSNTAGLAQATCLSGQSYISAAGALAAGLSLGAPAPAGAQYCDGTVHGLSGHYNLATGSGFLAVRAQPNSSSRMVGQLFNGDHTEILDRRGNWYQV